MAVFFRKTLIGNPRNPSNPKKWYCMLRRISLIKTKELAKRVADETTLNPKEVEMAVVGAGKRIVQLLMNGNSVEIEDFGVFRLTAKSEGTDNKEDLTAKNITDWHIRFTPFDNVRDQMSHIRFVDVDSLTNKK